MGFREPEMYTTHTRLRKDVSFDKNLINNEHNNEFTE